MSAARTSTDSCRPRRRPRRSNAPRRLIREATNELASWVPDGPRNMYEGLTDDGDYLELFRLNPVIGRLNPVAPRFELEVRTDGPGLNGTEVIARMTLGSALRGADGHGARRDHRVAVRSAPLDRQHRQRVRRVHGHAHGPLPATVPARHPADVPLPDRPRRGPQGVRGRRARTSKISWWRRRRKASSSSRRSNAWPSSWRSVSRSTAKPAPDSLGLGAVQLGERAADLEDVLRSRVRREAERGVQRVGVAGGQG